LFKTIRTARSRTSGEYLFVALLMMLHPTQVLEPPANPGRFSESIAANITPDKGTGIGNYTDAEIKRVITKGVKKDGTKLRPPMCTRCYDKMTEEDLDAMVAYLKSIKPIKNELR
jgi:hypothetical protein